MKVTEKMWRLKDQYESGINLWNSWVINVPAVSYRPLLAVGTNGTIFSAGTLFWQCLLPSASAGYQPLTSLVSSDMFIGIWLLGCGHCLPICLVFFSGNCRIIYMSVHIYSCQMVLPLHGNPYASTLSGTFLGNRLISSSLLSDYRVDRGSTSCYMKPHPNMECVWPSFEGLTSKA